MACTEEAPQLEKNIWQVYRSQGLQVLGISLTTNAAAVKTWGDTLGLTYPLLLDQNYTIWGQYGMGYIPHNTVIDTNMIVRYTNYDYHEATIIDIIKTYLPFRIYRTIHVPADYATIQQAIDHASDGDTVLVAPGTYDLSASIINNRVHNLQLIGSRREDGSDSCIIQAAMKPGTYNCILFKNVSGCRIQGFEVRNGSAGIVLDSCQSCLITKNFIHDNDELAAWHGDGIGIFHCENITITYNIIDWHEFHGIDVNYGNNHINIINNTIVRIGYDVIVLAGPVCDNVTIKNNIIAYSNEEGIELVYLVPPSPVNFINDYNCIWQNAKGPIKSPYTLGPHTIQVDPMITDIINHDFYLQPGSPCLGTGEGGANIGALGLFQLLPLLSVSPTMLDFGLTENSMTFEITNAGGSTLSWNIFENPEVLWITSITPASGIDAAQVTVQIDRSKLGSGMNMATLTVSSNGGNQDITVKAQGKARAIYVPSDFLTIQQAIDGAGDGDTIVVAPGDYDISSSIRNDRVDNLQLIGARDENGANASFINAAPNFGAFDCLVFKGVSHCTIEGFEVKNGASGIVLDSCQSCVITNNYIHNNDELNASQGNGIEITHSRQIDITFCIIDSNEFRGINMDNSEYVTILNNTILRTVRYEGIAFNDNSNYLIIKNNIIAYNKEEGIETSYANPSSFVHDYNCFWQNGKEPIKGHPIGSNSMLADPLLVDISACNFHLRSGSPCVGTGENGVNIGALGIATAVTPMSRLEFPTEFRLSQNYPNPFNPETYLNYQLPEPSRVLIKIYNTRGQEIRELVNEDKPAGYHTVKWDGRDNNNDQAVSGIYLYRIQAGSFISSMKMVLLR